MLVIAGSDTSGGAGLQADLRTAVQLGARALTVATALTAQSSELVHSIDWLSPAAIARQLKAAQAEASADAVKIGMIASASVARAVALYLAQLHTSTPVVYDPVFKASSDGTALWRGRSRPTAVVLRELLSHVTVLTPTWREAATLLDEAPPSTAAQAIAHCQHLLAYLAPEAHVILKGGDAETHLPTLTDRIIDRNGVTDITRPRLPKSIHGTGCIFATALALQLSTGQTIAQALVSAGDSVARGITQYG